MVRGWYRTVAVLAAAVVWGWTGSAAGVELFTVAKTGDPAPGAGGGVTFTGFSGMPFFNVLDVNEAGEVAFVGALSDSGQGIWKSAAAGIELVARSGGLAPGVGGGATFTEFWGPVLNDAGEVAFRGRVSNSKDGIWLADPGGPALVALDSGSAPPTVFPDFNVVSGPALNEAGEVAFVVDFGAFDPIFGIPREGIVVGGPGGLQQVTSGGSLARLLLNGAGELAFRRSVPQNMIFNPASVSIEFGRPGNLVNVASRGGNLGLPFQQFFLSRPTLNGAGALAYSGSLVDDGSGLWVGRPDSLVQLARDGDPAPASGRKFKSFGDPILNGHGEVLFDAILDGSVDAIYVGGLNNLTLVARTGDPAPGAGQGVTFVTLETRGLSEAGDVLFSATLSDSRESHWFAGPGDPELIVADGSVIEVAPGDLRTVAPHGVSLFPSSGEEGGNPDNFNGRGQVAFIARFTDATEALFLTPPPAPPQVLFRSRQALDKAWRTVSLGHSFTDPVVIAGPPGFEDKQPGVVRLRRVTGNSFQVRFDEWQYLDGKHAEEILAFLVMGKGRVKLADGSIWEAGTVKVRGNDNWRSKAFRKPFPGRPQLFLTPQSTKGPPVTVRARNVRGSGFEAALFEEESVLGTGHGRETVGYLAVYSATKGGTVGGGIGDTDYVLKRGRVKHKFRTVLGQKIKLEEEKSADRERRHARERVSVMRLGSGYFAQQISDKERDTTALRRR